MNQQIDRLSLAELADLLQATPRLLRNELEPLPEAVCRWRPAEDEWCINEVIGHLIEADRHGFDGRIRIILAQDQPQLSAWDIPGAVERRQDCERAGLALVADLAAGRAKSATLVRQLKPDQLLRFGIHPLAGELRVIDLVHEWLHHDRRHVKQVLSNVQAYVWPHMGNSQRFSEIW